MVSNSRKKDHLPVFGAGPAYVITIVALTIAGIVLSQLGILPYLRIRSTIIVLHSLGTICFIVGIWLWVSAAIKEKLQDKIVANKLVTTGVYSVVRHPIYSAFAFVMTGILLIYSNKIAESDDIIHESDVFYRRPIPLYKKRYFM